MPEVQQIKYLLVGALVVAALALLVLHSGAEQTRLDRDYCRAAPPSACVNGHPR